MAVQTRAATIAIQDHFRTSFEELKALREKKREEPAGALRNDLLQSIRGRRIDLTLRSSREGRESEIGRASFARSFEREMGRDWVRQKFGDDVYKGEPSSKNSDSDFSGVNFKERGIVEWNSPEESTYRVESSPESLLFALFLRSPQQRVWYNLIFSDLLNSVFGAILSRMCPARSLAHGPPIPAALLSAFGFLRKFRASGLHQ